MKLFKGKIGQYPKNLTGNLANSTVVHKKLRKKDALEHYIRSFKAISVGNLGLS